MYVGEWAKKENKRKPAQLIMNCVKPLRGKLGRTFFFVQRKLQSSFTHSNREQESW